MKYYALLFNLLLAILFPVSLKAQNLVPNPSFESKNACPTGLTPLDYSIDYSPAYNTFPTVTGWVSPMPRTNGSPDYYNKCAVGTSVEVPEADWGYQDPRNGDAFAGIIAWEGVYSGGAWTHDAREYLQCKLLQPLQAGKKYCVSFYVNPTISSVFNNINYVAIDEIGVNFSVVQQTQPTGYYMNLPYHIKSPIGQFIVDTLPWIKITGIFTATGGEQWMTLGCFNNGAPPNKKQLYPTVPINNNIFKAYMFIDDVSVVPISPNDTIYVAHDTAVCDPQIFSQKLLSSGNETVYQWSTGSTDKEIVVDKLGTYWCRSQSYCQTIIDTFHVKFDPGKKLSLGNDTGSCFNQPCVITPNGNFYNFSWSTGATTPTITVNQSGIYYLTATNECGTHTDSVRIYIQPPTEMPKVTDTMICQFAEDPQVKVIGTNIKWYAQLNSIIGNEYQPYIHTDEPGKDVIYVTQTIGDCESDRKPINVDIKYKPRNILSDEMRMCEKYRDTIGVQIPDVKYKWSTGESVCCLLPDREGEYRVAISNECGSYIDTVKVIFSVCDDCVALPNAFTPNRDGSNDRFNTITTCPLDQYHMRIFNRWGNMVFDSQNPNEGWDGTYQGQPSNGGTYIYLVEYRSGATGSLKAVKGNLTLIR